jgi:tetratricopeptide (TPR) repeat protein
MNFGLMLFSLSQYQKASDQFSGLLNDSIWSARAFCYNGLCSYALGEYELALQNLEACTGDSSLIKQLHGIKGNAALVLKHWDDAADFYDKAILEDPDYPAYYLNRGIAQFWLKKYEKAHSDFTVSLALQPDQKKANLYRAYCEEAMGNDLAALQDFKQAGVNRPDIEKRLGRSEFLAKYWYFLVIVFLLSVLLIVVVLHRSR